MNQYTRGRDTTLVYSTFGPPNYYDAPEGKHPWEKIWGLNKFAIPAGLFLGTLDCFVWTEASGVLKSANCIGHWVVPFVGLSTAFTSMTYIATNVRGKDDKINYAIGALSCAPVLYAWKKTAMFTSIGTAFLMAAALLKKDSKQNGWEFFPKIQFEYGTYLPDYSFVSEEWPRRPI